MKTRIRKSISMLLALMLVISLTAVAAVPASAAGSMTFEFDIGAGDGSSELAHDYAVEPGSSFDVTLMLKRTDSSATPYSIFAMQNELEYDTGFFTIIRTKAVKASVVDVNSAQRLGEYVVKVSSQSREFTTQDVVLCTFTVKARAGLEEGTTTTIRCSNMLVLDEDHASCTVSAPNELKVYIGSELPSHTVTYDLDGGTMDPSAFPELEKEFEESEDENETRIYAQTVVKGSAIKLPVAPSKENSTFVGWMLPNNVTVDAEDEVSFYSDSTVTAVWKSFPTITLDTAGGSIGGGEKQLTAKPGTTIHLPTATKDSAVFGGWSDGKTTYTNKYVMGDKDVTLTAVWSTCKHEHATYAESSRSDAQHIDGTNQHYYTVYKKATCPDCEQELAKTDTVYENCTYSDWVITKTEHYKECSKCHGIENRGSHTYKDGVCTVCGYKDPDYKGSSGTGTGKNDNDKDKDKPDENPKAKTAFEDVAIGSYYEDAVAWAAENGITYGVDSTHFAPNVGCTRAQFVTFLWRAAGQPEPTTTNPFSDVNETTHAPYIKAILWAVEKGITSGDSTTGNTFGPDNIVTRGQAVTFMYRYAGNESGDMNKQLFDDVPVKKYYSAPVDWAVTKGITRGNSTEANTFGPFEPCIRAQMVVFLYRLFVLSA